MSVVGDFGNRWVIGFSNKMEVVGMVYNRSLYCAYHYIWINDAEEMFVRW